MDDLKSRPDDETTFVPQAPNSFQRGASNVQKWLDADEGAEFPPEPGRYHLFLNYGCGWCHQVLQVLELRKIDRAGVSITHVGCYRGGARGTPEYQGWVIQAATEESTGRSFSCIRDVYNAFDGTYGLNQLTIPVLYDKKTTKVVSNDPAQMLLMLDFYAERLASSPEAPQETPLLYPAELREEIEAVNRVVFPGINNGVYCCWFGGQDALPAFKEGFALVQDALQWLEDLLARNRKDSKLGPYLLGTEHPTLADVRAFPHLFRFDAIYAELMLRGRGKRIFQGEFPSLAGWIRDLMFGLPEIHRTCDLQVATRFYFSNLPVEESDAIYDGEREASGGWLPTREQWATKRCDEGMIPAQADIPHPR